MKTKYTVAREVRTPIEGAPLTFNGATPTRLSFEVMRAGLSKHDAAEIVRRYNDPAVVFFKE